MTTSSWAERYSGRLPRRIWALLAGGLAGALAALLLLTLSPLYALLALGALAAGVLVLLAPHAGLYLFASSMIAQWPGQVLKLGAAGVIGATLVWAVVRRRRLIPHDSLFLVLLPLLALIWLSALSVHDPNATRVAGSWTGYIFFYWAVSTLAENERTATRMAAVFLLSGVVTALIGLVQWRLHFTWIITAYTESSPFLYLGSSDFRDLQDWQGSFRIDSVTGSENYMGVAMNLPLAFAAYWTARQKTLLGRLVGGGMLAALVIALVLSLTRGAMLIAFFVVAPFLVFKFGWRRMLPYALAGLVLLAVAVAAYEPLRSRAVATVEQTLSADPTTAGGWRLSVIDVGLGIFADHFWTGVGLEQHRWAIRRFAPSEFVNPVEDAQLQFHNAYLWIAVELGIFGISLVVIWLGMIWRRLRRLQRYFHETGQQRLEDLSHAAEVAWVALICDMAFYPVVDAIFRYHWVLLGVIAALTRIAWDQRESNPQMEIEQSTDATDAHRWRLSSPQMPQMPTD